MTTSGPGPQRKQQPVERLAEASVPLWEKFDAFFAEVWPELFRTMLMITGDRELAADASQEAMVRACYKWERLTYPKAWAMRVAINYCKRWWSRTGNREVLEAELAKSDLTIEDLAREAPAAVMSDPDFLGAVAELSPRQRTIMALHYLYGWPIGEIPKVLGISAVTVAVHHHRALTKLREKLRERKGDGEGEGPC